MLWTDKPFEFDSEGRPFVLDNDSRRLSGFLFVSREPSIMALVQKLKATANIIFVWAPPRIGTTSFLNEFEIRYRLGKLPNTERRPVIRIDSSSGTLSKEKLAEAEKASSPLVIIDNIGTDLNAAAIQALVRGAQSRNWKVVLAGRWKQFQVLSDICNTSAFDFAPLELDNGDSGLERATQAAKLGDEGLNLDDFKKIYSTCLGHLGLIQEWYLRQHSPKVHASLQNIYPELQGKVWKEYTQYDYDAAFDHDAIGVKPTIDDYRSSTSPFAPGIDGNFSQMMRTPQWQSIIPPIVEADLDGAIWRAFFRERTSDIWYLTERLAQGQLSVVRVHENILVEVCRQGTNHELGSVLAAIKSALQRICDDPDGARKKVADIDYLAQLMLLFDSEPKIEFDAEATQAPDAKLLHRCLEILKNGSADNAENALFLFLLYTRVLLQCSCRMRLYRIDSTRKMLDNVFFYGYRSDGSSSDLTAVNYKHGTWAVGDFVRELDETEDHTAAVHWKYLEPARTPVQERLAISRVITLLPCENSGRNHSALICIDLTLADDNALRQQFTGDDGAIGNHIKKIYDAVNEFADQITVWLDSRKQQREFQGLRQLARYFAENSNSQISFEERLRRHETHFEEIMKDMNLRTLNYFQIVTMRRQTGFHKDRLEVTNTHPPSLKSYFAEQGIEASTIERLLDDLRGAENTLPEDGTGVANRINLSQVIDITDDTKAVQIRRDGPTLTPVAKHVVEFLSRLNDWNAHLPPDDGRKLDLSKVLTGSFLLIVRTAKTKAGDLQVKDMAATYLGLGNLDDVTFNERLVYFQLRLQILWGELDQLEVLQADEVTKKALQEVSSLKLGVDIGAPASELVSKLTESLKTVFAVLGPRNPLTKCTYLSLRDERALGLSIEPYAQRRELWKSSRLLEEHKNWSISALAICAATNAGDRHKLTFPSSTPSEALARFLEQITNDRDCRTPNLIRSEDDGNEILGCIFSESDSTLWNEVYRPIRQAETRGAIRTSAAIVVRRPRRRDDAEQPRAGNAGPIIGVLVFESSTLDAFNDQQMSAIMRIAQTYGRILAESLDLRMANAIDSTLSAAFRNRYDSDHERGEIEYLMRSRDLKRLLEISALTEVEADGPDAVTVDRFSSQMGIERAALAGEPFSKALSEMQQTSLSRDRGFTPAEIRKNGAKLVDTLRTSPNCVTALRALPRAEHWDNWVECLTQLLSSYYEVAPDQLVNSNLRLMTPGYSAGLFIALSPEGHFPIAIKFGHSNKIDGEITANRRYVVGKIHNAARLDFSSRRSAGRYGLVASTLVGATTPEKPLLELLWDPAEQFSAFSAKLSDLLNTVMSQWRSQSNGHKRVVMRQAVLQYFDINDSDPDDETEQVKRDTSAYLQTKYKHYESSRHGSYVNLINGLQKVLVELDGGKGNVYTRISKKVASVDDLASSLVDLHCISFDPSEVETVCAHGDLNANNIVLDPKAGIFALIDFEKCGLMPSLIDYAKLECSVRFDISRVSSRAQEQLKFDPLRIAQRIKCAFDVHGSSATACDLKELLKCMPEAASINDEHIVDSLYSKRCNLVELIRRSADQAHLHDSQPLGRHVSFNFNKFYLPTLYAAMLRQCEHQVDNLTWLYSDNEDPFDGIGRDSSIWIYGDMMLELLAGTIYLRNVISKL